MFLLFLGKLLKHGASARVLRDARGTRVKLQPAALGCDGDAQRISGKNQLRRPALGCRPPGLAFLARAVNLDNALLAGEVPCRRHFLDQRLDIGAEKLERLVAGLANQVEVPRVAVGVFEPEPSFAEVDLPSDTRIHHPLEGAVHRRPADTAIFFADQIDKVVGTEVTFLTEEGVDDEIAFAGSLASSRAHPLDIDPWHAPCRKVVSGCARGGHRRPLRW